MVTSKPRADYVQLYEVSVEGLRERDEEVFRATTKIATHGVRDAMKQCTNDCPAIRERLDWIEHAAGVVHRNRLQLTERLERECDPKTDTALFYHLRAAAREELGWVVMRGRNIKSRIVVFADDMPPESK